jgi:nicotinamide-nucleotide adenylyltransferase
MSGAAPRRAVCIWDLQEFSEWQLELLQSLEADHDELVIVVTSAAEGYTPEQPLPAGERIARLAPALRARLQRPVYLLPVKRDGLSDAQYMARLRLMVPAFTTLVCHTVRAEQVARCVLGPVTRLVPWVDATPTAFTATGNPPRGLFVTRAQFFHNGHREFVRQMAREQEEVIVLVAMANASHTARNPATAAERLEMIRPVLELEVPGRFHLCAAPYVDHDGANFAEVSLLVPRFQTVYSNSPSTTEMARSDGYATRCLQVHVQASGSEIRRRIASGESYEELMPPEAYRVLQNSPALQRLIALSRPESR